MEICENPKIFNFKYPPSYFYLTSNCAYLAILTGTLYFLKYLTNNKKYKNTNIIINKFYTSFLQYSLSLNTTMVLIFWPLYFIDQKFVKEEISLIKECNTPLFTELSKHLFPFVFLILGFTEVSFSRRIIDRLFIYSFGVYYFILICVFKKMYGYYPYGILRNLSKLQVTIFTLCVTIIVDIIHYYFYKLNRKLKRIQN